MLLSDRSPTSTPFSGEGTNSLRLRLGNDGQLIDLPFGKTTVGSSPRCNLRIEQSGVQPLHCLIVHGPEGLTVRRWAADTKLNGLAFDDARLAAGDFLMLGGVELELVGPLVEAPGRKTSAWAADLPVRGEALASSSNAVADLSQTNSEALPIARDRETAAFDWSSMRPAFEAASVDANESTEKECAMLMDVVQDSFDAMNNLEDEPANAAAGEPFESVSCEQEYLPATDVVVEDTIGEEFAIDLAAASECDIELDIDKVADASVGHVTGFSGTDISEVGVVDAAEVVFRELQAACAMSRGRSWKLLTALRKEREQKQELLERLAMAGEQLEALSAQQPDDFAVSETQTREDRDWEQEAQRLRRQIAAWERQVAEYAARMTELQHELAAAKAGEPATGRLFEPKELPTVHADEFSGGLPTPVAGDAIEPAVDSRAAGTSEEAGAASHEPAHREDPFGGEPRPARVWVSPSGNVGDLGKLESTAAAGPVEHTSETFGEDDTSDPFGDAPQAASWSDKMRQSEVGISAETGRNDWLPPSMPHEADDVFGDSGESTAAAAIEVKAPAWARREAESSQAASEQAEDDISPFAEFSIWKQGAHDDAPVVVTESDAEPHAEIESAPASGEEPGTAPIVEPTPLLINLAPTAARAADQTTPAIQEANELVRPAAQPTSFIERYAHLFEEGNIQESPAVAPAPPAGPASVAASTPRVMGVVRRESGDSAAAMMSDEEESLEEYMAKLLQRVRGDVPPTSVPLVAPAPIAASVSTREQLQDRDHAKSEDGADQVEVDWEAIARKAASLPKADLGALRALANQTARQAISRHALTRHRRDTVTKVIVSTLAGMTSLWLMLEAPSWYDLQFVTACVALIGAAYWAVEAYQELSAGWRVAAAYEALHGDDDTEVTLPIDVEKR